jgi:ribonuclease HII
MMTKPDFSLEKDLPGPVAGIDEVGRGPWAGPVVAAACILDIEVIDKDTLSQLNDSKKLTKAKRERLFEFLTYPEQAGVSYGIGEASPQEIDQLNILQATFLAMRRAVDVLPVTPQALLIDGNQDPKLGILTQLVVKGDSKSVSIAAASIIAKVYRDEVMERLAEENPGYGWESNAGYGTHAHQQGLSQHGVTVHHRQSYKPVMKCLTQAA